MMLLASTLVGCMFLHAVFASIASDCLQKHNVYRDKHGVPALQYSTDLAKDAQQLAAVLTTAKNETEEKVSHGTYDVNFFVASWPTARTISDAVENWYNEGNSYNYNDPQVSTSNNRFVEILWKSHKRIGCGLAIAKEKGGLKVRTAVVAIYEPAGIRLDTEDYIENVLPPN